MWVRVIILIIIAWILQALFTFLQISNYRKRIRELKKKGKLGIGKVSRKLSAGTIVFLVSDDSKTIIDAERMSGITVFARFKKDKELIGKSLAELEEKEFKNKAKTEAVKKAVENLKSQFQSED
ncbi:MULTISPECIES: transcriptional regulator GutM [unclassified Halanaerobium]|uniref:transcriptional regulator GutM n=1 Tax=unclassified Halanaerobium TaxID=2641197 RepID=UPI000DF26D62|nr:MULTISPECIES: transcriptional regulator GutM [unclassified Halanaerobium]RCW47361.1 glucitol operon activator protein [Halanaerobium sp. MA284_MarDTE_T2]RCW84900.1 glucitol operon activator protein [Halanaerobium sp. DL-01]